MNSWSRNTHYTGYTIYYLAFMGGVSKILCSSPTKVHISLVNKMSLFLVLVWLDAVNRLLQGEQMDLLTGITVQESGESIFITQSECHFTIPKKHRCQISKKLDLYVVAEMTRSEANDKTNSISVSGIMYLRRWSHSLVSVGHFGH